MSIFDFFKNAGESVLGAIPGADAAKKLVDHMAKSGLGSGNVQVEYDPAGEVKVTGTAVSQAEKEKILLALGNVKGVSKVSDAITVEGEVTEVRFYTVQAGDTLGKIAKHFYGKSGQYVKIFEANKPMLSDPDKIYPGQSLRIPA
jgi:nucleoid-associated protein YgaU